MSVKLNVGFAPQLGEVATFAQKQSSLWDELECQIGDHVKIVRHLNSNHPIVKSGISLDEFEFEGRDSGDFVFKLNLPGYTNQNQFEVPQKEISLTQQEFENVLGDHIYNQGSRRCWGWDREVTEVDLSLGSLGLNSFNPLNLESLGCFFVEAIVVGDQELTFSTICHRMLSRQPALVQSRLADAALPSQKKAPKAKAQ